MKYISKLVLFFLIVGFASAQEAWKYELEEEVKIIDFLDEGNKLFIGADEYIYLFDTKSGEKIYQVELEDFLSVGVYNLVENTFLVATDDETLVGYDALTGKIKWTKVNEDLDQEDFKELHIINGKPVIQYGSLHISIDLNTGAFKWGNVINYSGEMTMMGGWNYSEYNKKDKFIVISPDEAAFLYDVNTGNEVGSFYDFEVDADIVKSGMPWTYTDQNENYTLFTLDDYFLAIDINSGREIARIEMDFDDDITPFVEVDNGIIVLSEERAVFFNTSNGKYAQLDVDIDDFRTYSVFNHKGKSYLFAGLDGQLSAYDLTTGNKLWATTEDDENFIGYPHRYLGIVDTQLIMSYVYGENPPNGGTWIRATSVDINNGKLIYNTDPVLLAEFYINSFSRTISSLSSDPLGFSKWDNIGFNYIADIVDDKVLFAVSSEATMLQPSTRDEGGDGIVIVNAKSGKVEFSDYNELNDYGSFNNGNVSRLEPTLFDSYFLISGNIRTALYDINKKERIWISDEYEEKYIVDASLKTDVLYLKYGFVDFDIKLSPPGLIGWFGASIEVKENRDEDPYGIMGLDPKNGKLLWNKELEVDPSFATPSFSIDRYYSNKNKTILFTDEEQIYSLGPTGEFNWKRNYADIGIGNIEYDNIYSVSEEFLAHEYKTKTTYEGYSYDIEVTRTFNSISPEGIEKFMSQMGKSDASLVYKSGRNYWGANAKKTLGLFVYDSDILVMASEGIARIDRLSGDVKWSTNWDYDPDDVAMTPIFLGDKLAYSFSEKLELIDYATGKKLWSAEEDSESKFLISPTGTFIFSIDEEDIKGYKVSD